MCFVFVTYGVWRAPGGNRAVIFGAEMILQYGYGVGHICKIVKKD